MLIPAVSQLVGIRPKGYSGIRRDYTQIMRVGMEGERSPSQMGKLRLREVFNPTQSFKPPWKWCMGQDRSFIPPRQDLKSKGIRQK